MGTFTPDTVNYSKKTGFFKEQNAGLVSDSIAINSVS